MKRILTYIVYSLSAALLVMSCSNNEMGFVDGNNSNALVFKAQSTEMQTKTAGEDTYKENTINTVDWFFYSDEEGTQLLHKLHSDGANLKLENVNVEGNEYHDLMYGAYLYAVANITLPETEPTGGWTLENLLKIPVSSSFTETKVNSDGDNEEVLDSLSLNFIMDTYVDSTKSYLQLIEPKAKDDVEPITVNLSRLAVKISTKFKIAKSVDTKDSFGNNETWTPVLSESDFDVYMVNALKAGYLNGEPVRRDSLPEDSGIQNSDYFSYGRQLTYVEELADEGNYHVWQVVNPFYTYPQTWKGEDNAEPYIKVIFPWMSNVKGSAEFHYKLVLPQPENGVFTLSRNCWYQVTATIKVLGGTENDYVLVDNVEYSVADWADPAWVSGTGLSSPVYFYVPKVEFDVYGIDTLDIPFYSNSDVEAYFTEIQFYDYSTSPTTNHDYTFSNETTTSTTVDGDDSRFILAVDNTNKVVDYTHSMSGKYVLRNVKLIIRKSSNHNKMAEVIIHHHPAIELKKQGAGDVFVNGRFARVSNAKFGTTWTTGGVTYYHSGNGWDDDRITTYDYSDYNWGSYSYGTITDGSNVQTSISRDWYTTDIAVTAFSNEGTNRNDYYTVNNTRTYYRIADPRVKASTHYTNFSLERYLTGEERTNYTDYYGIYNDITSTWTNPGDILISSQNSTDQSKIAPHFLVSSALNANTGLSWQQVVRRAATYQEAGYPAGRWRIPTEAEMAFIVARQKDGTIPNLYATNTTYWSGSGRVLNMSSSTANNLVFRDRRNDDNMSVRFVYDLWYWGDTPLSSNEYHANGHIE